MPFVFVYHFPFKNIGFADKFGGKAAVGIIIDIAWCIHLLQLAVGHNRHTGSHGHGFFLVMGNHDAGYTHFFQSIDQFKLGLLAQLFIQCTQRFVQQQQLRTLGQGTCECHTLLLAA